MKKISLPRFVLFLLLFLTVTRICNCRITILSKLSVSYKGHLFSIFNKILHLLRLNDCGLKIHGAISAFFHHTCRINHSLKFVRFNYCKVVTQQRIEPYWNLFISFTVLWYRNTFCWKAKWENLVLALGSNKTWVQLLVMLLYYAILGKFFEVILSFFIWI